MLLPMQVMQKFINRDRNQSAIASKTGLSQKTINNIANCKDFDKFDNLVSTQQKLSDYFMNEYDYMDKVIIKLRGE
jgi:DNA-binding XRE family transcriptional regulator